MHESVDTLKPRPNVELFMRFTKLYFGSTIIKLRSRRGRIEAIN